ncbi:MAG: plasmid mobilization protein [Mediterraneibacter sp.]
MRNRSVQILFRLNEEEAQHLYELVKRSGRSKEAFLREMVKGYRLCEKPDPEFYKIMRELSAIGNRINQLAAKANALGFVDAPMLSQEWYSRPVTVRAVSNPPQAMRAALADRQLG